MTLSARGDFVCAEAPGRTLLLRQGKANTFGFGAYAVGDAAEWEALVGRVKASGGSLPSPTPLLPDPFAGRDPDGSRSKSARNITSRTGPRPTSGSSGPLAMSSSVEIRTIRFTGFISGAE